MTEVERVVGWQPIETAPKDGSRIWAKRVYDDKLVSEGWARWGINSEDSPMRKPAPGGLYGAIPADNAYADKPRWLTEDCRFSFPTPTHWMPLPPPPQGAS